MDQIEMMVDQNQGRANPHMIPMEGPMLKIAPTEILHKPQCCEDATGWGLAAG